MPQLCKAMPTKIIKAKNFGEKKRLKKAPSPKAMKQAPKREACHSKYLALVKGLDMLIISVVVQLHKG